MCGWQWTPLSLWLRGWCWQGRTDLHDSLLERSGAGPVARCAAGDGGAGETALHGSVLEWSHVGSAVRCAAGENVLDADSEVADEVRSG